MARVLALISLPVLLAAIGGFWLAEPYLQVWIAGVGGVPPAYRARQNDPILTGVARTAKPLMAALDRFRETYGTYPAPDRPEHVVRLQDMLPASVRFLRSGSVRRLVSDGREWVYDVADQSSGYRISSRLGWDPSLVYEKIGSTGRWMFQPGDGTDERPLTLAP
jgi:hypothetical protein